MFFHIYLLQYLINHYIFKPFLPYIQDSEGKRVGRERICGRFFLAREMYPSAYRSDRHYGLRGGHYRLFIESNTLPEHICGWEMEANADFGAPYYKRSVTD
jgi:hypothetical protein